MIELKDRVAIVTGASRGIGRAIALGLARSGCHVVIAAKSTESTEKLPGSIFTVAEEAATFGIRAVCKVRASRSANISKSCRRSSASINSPACWSVRKFVMR